MKTKIFFLLFLSTLWVFSNDMTGEPVYIIDYNVPESPAFTILGLNPNHVQRGSSAKPVVINLVNKFLSKEKVDDGIAIDFNPLFAFGLTIKDINEYKKYPLYLLSNLQLSFATVSTEEEKNSLVYAFGVRITLFDSKDLYVQNENVRRSISTRLRAKGIGNFQPGEDSIITEYSLKLKQYFSELTDSLNKINGYNLALGYAGKGLLKSSILATDSLVVNLHQIWLAGQYSINKLDLLGTIVSRFSGVQKTDYMFGVALRYNFSEKVSISGECVYKSQEVKKPLDFGVSLDYKIHSQISFILSISSEKEETKNKVRIGTNIKWNLSNIEL